MLITNYDIIIGDSREIELEEESLHFIITSPPYWDLIDYFKNNKNNNHNNNNKIKNNKNNSNNFQIGFNQSFEEYLEDLKKVFTNCFKVLKKGCRLCVNIGDLYTRSKEYGRYKVIPIEANLITILEEIGFDFMGDIIWRKLGNSNPSGNGKVMGSYPYPRSPLIKFNREYICIFKKRGKDPKVDLRLKRQSKLSKEEWLRYTNDIWKINGTKNENHPATFPLEIPFRLIKMFSFVGDTILDPFLGSGTTMLASRMLKRSCIGIEINEKDYLPEIKDKVKFGNRGVLQDCNFNIINQKERF
jgi:modification methylase